VCLYTHIYTHTYIHTHIYTHTCIDTHIYTHTYIHTHNGEQQGPNKNEFAPEQDQRVDARYASIRGPHIPEGMYTYGVATIGRLLKNIGLFVDYSLIL